MFEMLDPSYLEADTFGLFTKLMDRMETYYRIRNVVPTASGELPRRRTTMNDSTNGDSVVSLIKFNYSLLRLIILLISRAPPPLTCHRHRRVPSHHHHKPQPQHLRPPSTNWSST